MKQNDADGCLGKIHLIAWIGNWANPPTFSKASRRENLLGMEKNLLRKESREFVKGHFCLSYKERPICRLMPVLFHNLLERNRKIFGKWLRLPAEITFTIVYHCVFLSLPQLIPLTFIWSWFNQVVVGLDSGGVVLVDVAVKPGAGPSLLASCVEHDNVVSSLSVAADGTRAVTGSLDRR